LSDEGFAKIHRKILKWEWYDDTPTRSVFIHLIIKANYESNVWRGETLEKGQHITSVKKIADPLGLSVKQVRRALDNLKKTGEIDIQTTNKWTMITLSEYSTYHEKKGGKGKQTTNEGQTEGKQRATKKKEKNDKNDKEVKKKKGAEEKDLIFPDCVDRTLCENYFNNRVEIKKKMTHHAKELFLEKVAKFHGKGQDVKTLIEKAIIGGWSDIYEDKDNGRKNAGTIKSKPVEKAGTKSAGKGNYIEGRKTEIIFVDKKGKREGSQEDRTGPA
jgi:DNA-binding transcriptional regulator YhcF (GntR family)